MRIFLAEKRITGVERRGHRRAAAAGGRLRGDAEPGLARVRVGRSSRRCCSTRRTSTATTASRRRSSRARRTLGHGHPLGARRCGRASRTPTTRSTSACTSSRTCSTSSRTHFDGDPGRPGDATRARVAGARGQGDGAPAARQVRHRPLRRGEPDGVPGRGGRGVLRDRPLALRERHREVYAILREYFGQDPAAWDDERGLVL